MKRKARLWTMPVCMMCREHMRGLMWSEEFVYYRCHERELKAVVNALTAEAHVGNYRM